jgi:hypothetical protein
LFATFIIALRYHKLPVDYTPDPKAIAQAQAKAGTKVAAITSMLRFFGKPKEALLLYRGFQTFATQNARPYDKSLLCSVANSQALSAQLSSEESELFPLVWSPEVMEKEQYGQYFLSGIRRLMLKQTTPTKLCKVSFTYIPDVPVEQAKGMSPRLGADVAAGFSAGKAAAASAAAAASSLVSPVTSGDVVIRASGVRDQQLLLDVAVCSHSDCSSSDVASPSHSPKRMSGNGSNSHHLAPMPALRVRAAV